MAIKQEIIDELLSNYKHPDDLLGEGGLFKELKKALLERALNAELSDHLGYEKGDPKGKQNANSRNGHGSKRITGEDGEMAISVPRDRDASFELRIVKKGQRRFEGFDLRRRQVRGIPPFDWNDSLQAGAQALAEAPTLLRTGCAGVRRVGRLV